MFLYLVEISIPWADPKQTQVHGNSGLPAQLLLL